MHWYAYSHTLSHSMHVRRSLPAWESDCGPITNLLLTSHGLNEGNQLWSVIQEAFRRHSWCIDHYHHAHGLRPNIKKKLNHPLVLTLQQTYSTDIYIYIYIVFHGQVPDSFTNKSPIFPGIDCLLSHHGSKIHDFGSTWFQNNTWSQTRQWNWFTLWKFDDLPSMSTPILHGKHLSSIPFSRCQWWYKPCEIPLIDD